MRLINTRTLEFEEFEGRNFPKYAILSHRWGEQEVLYRDMINGTARQKTGFQKLRSCCREAEKENIKYVWIDTCCIDKSSSAELSEAINSMYRLYQNCLVCYVHMSDVHATYENNLLDRIFKQSVWFTRGWTLQELLAPRNIQFFNSRWLRIGGMKRFQQAVIDVTSIPAHILNHQSPLNMIPIAQRMSWAAGRQTTRTEDEAYSLMGIFEINMPMLYGEGKNAFRRLQEEIIKRSNDTSILFWEGGPLSLLATSPSLFQVGNPQDSGKSSSNVWLRDPGLLVTDEDLRPYGLGVESSTMTNVGLSVSIPILPWHYNTYLALVAVVSPLTPSALYCFIYLGKLSSGSKLFRTRWRGKNVTCMTAPELEKGNLAIFDLSFATHTRQVVISLDSTLLLRHPNFNDYQGDAAGSFYFHLKSSSVWGPTGLPQSSDVISRSPWKPEETGSKATDEATYPLQPSVASELIAIIRVTLLTGEREYLFFGYDRDFNPFVVLDDWHRQEKVSSFDDCVSQGSDCTSLKHVLNASYFWNSLENNTSEGQMRALVCKGSLWRTRFEDLGLNVNILECSQPAFDVYIEPA